MCPRTARRIRNLSYTEPCLNIPRVIFFQLCCFRKPPGQPAGAQHHSYSHRGTQIQISNPGFKIARFKIYSAISNIQARGWRECTYLGRIFRWISNRWIAPRCSWMSSCYFSIPRSALHRSQRRWSLAFHQGRWLDPGQRSKSGINAGIRWKVFKSVSSSCARSIREIPQNWSLNSDRAFWTFHTTGAQMPFVV
mgnify:CR=1 FL=1